MKKFKFYALAAMLGMSLNVMAEEEPIVDPISYAVNDGVWYSYNPTIGDGTKGAPYQATVFGVADTDDGVTELTIPASFEKANQADQKMYFQVVGFNADWAQQGSLNVDGVDGDEDFAAVSVTLATLTVNIDNMWVVYDNEETEADESWNPYLTMTDGLKKLTSLTISDSRKDGAGKWAPQMLSLAELQLSATVVKKLTTLDISNTNILLGAGSEFKVLQTGEWAKLTTITLPKALLAIGVSTFENSAITAISIPATVSTIGASAFKKATAIQTVAIPAATTSIGASAFEGCSNLATVDFSAATKLQTIGADAFKGDAKLTAIDLSKANISTGLGAAFSGCSGITAVTLNNKVTNLVGGLFADTKIEEIVAEGAEIVGTIMGEPSEKKPNTTLKKVTLGPVTSMAANAFQYCQALEEVTIGFDAEKVAEKQAEIEAIIANSEAYLATFQSNVDDAQAALDLAEDAVDDARAELSTVIGYNARLTAAKAAEVAAATALETAKGNIVTKETALDAAEAGLVEAELTGESDAEAFEAWVAAVDALEVEDEELSALATAYTDAVTLVTTTTAAYTALTDEIDADGYTIGEGDQIATGDFTEALTTAITAQIGAEGALEEAKAALAEAELEVADALENAEELEEGLIVREKTFYYDTALTTFNYSPDNADAKYVNDEAFLGCSSKPLVLFVTSTVYQEAFTAPYQTTYGNEAATTVTTVADKGTSGKFFAKFHATSKVSIDPEDALVYSVYVDEGTAYFQALQKRGGLYVLFPGDNVILKTDGAKEIEITPYNGTASKSSVLEDYIICSDEATTVTALQDAGLIATGEYLYRLTNNAASGGFGFTYYTKDEIKAGQFFIASTKAPAASGRINVVWLDEEGNVEEATAINGIVKKAQNNGAIYNLAGQKVNAAYKGVVIKDGKKMIMK